MVPVSNVDRAVLLLRQRLERARSSRAASGSAAAASRRPAAQAGSVQALAALGELDRKQLRRALVQAVLAEQFGERVLNEPEFQQIVERVASAIGEDEGALGVIDGALRQLRAPPR